MYNDELENKAIIWKEQGLSRIETSSRKKYIYFAIWLIHRVQFDFLLFPLSRLLFFKAWIGSDTFLAFSDPVLILEKNQRYACFTKRSFYYQISKYDQYVLLHKCKLIIFYSS